MKNTLPSSIPATTQEMVGFIVFWVVSVPFLFIRPERFKKPFFFSSVGCGVAMLAMMIWSLAVARGVGPVFYKGQDVPSTSRFGVSWIMMAALNQAIGQKVAGVVNESDFSRYANSYTGFVVGVVSVQWVIGILVSFGGLVTTAACQIIYGEIWWNPPDLMMVMMDSRSALHIFDICTLLELTFQQMVMARPVRALAYFFWRWPLRSLFSSRMCVGTRWQEGLTFRECSRDTSTSDGVPLSPSWLPGSSNPGSS